MKTQPLKLFFALIFFTFFYVNINAQDKVYHNLSEVPIYWNLDSLEKNLIRTDTNSTIYINQLISLERSRDIYNSVYFGKHIQEIEHANVGLQLPFLTGYTNYLKLRYHTISREGDYKLDFDAADKAIQIFKSIGDTTGLFNAYCQKAYLETLLQKAISNNAMNRGSFNSQDMKYAELLMDSARVLICNNVSRYIIYWSTKEIIAYNSSSDVEKLKQVLFYCYHSFNKIQHHDEYKNFALISSIIHLGSTFNRYAYEGNTKMHDSALYYLKKGLTIKPNPESTAKPNLYAAISNYYHGKEDYISTIQYADLVEHFLDSLHVHMNYLYVVPYNNKTNAYKALINTKKYAEYVHNLYDLRDKIIASDNGAQFSILNYQSTQTKVEFEKKVLAGKLDYNRNIIALICIFLILLVVFLFVQFKNANKLRKQNDMIQNLLLTREKFYSILAHDIRSPMKSYFGIASKISYLIKKGKYDDIQELSEKIDSTGLRLDGLFQNLISWSQLQEKQIGLDITSFNPNEIINNLLPLYNAISESKVLTIETNLVKDIEIRTDKNSFGLIARNMIDNAIKNTEQQAIIISTNIDSTKTFHLSVQNKSHINDEKFDFLKNIFESNELFQPGEKGLGMGMILIRDFSRKIGGNIKVTKDGNDITFMLSIPNISLEI